MANPTASTIIGLARDLLRAESTSDVPALGDSFMLSLLSDGNLKWARAFRKTGSQPISFLRETGFDLIADDTLDETNGITTSDTEFTVTTGASYENSSAVVIWDDAMPDVVPYTTYTSGTKTFSGASGIGFAHEDDDTVQALYKLPTNFGKFRKSALYGDGVLLNGIPLRYMSAPPVAGFFSDYDDGTNKYLWLPRGSTGTASVLYEKASATIDSVDDTVDVPEEFKMFLVWHLIAHSSMGREGNGDLYLMAVQNSERILQEALIDRNVGKKIRTRPLGRIPKDYIVVDGTYIGIL